MRSVETRGFTDIRDMRVVGQDGDSDVDADAWRSKGVVYGEMATVGERVRSLVDDVGYVWVEGK